MSVLNLTKKEKISLTIIVFSLVILILSIGYFLLFFQESIKNYNLYFVLVAFFSALIFIFASRYLTTGSLKYENFYSEDEIVVKRKYEVLKISLCIVMFIPIIFFLLIFTNDNFLNFAFNYESLVYIEKIISGNGDLEQNIKMVDRYIYNDIKLDAIWKICIPFCSFPIAYNLSSLFVWFKYKKQGLD